MRRQRPPVRLPAGKPLDRETRAEMEARFGRSFEEVRIHTGPEAARAAEALNAQAFSVGDQIAFDAGQYRPWSADGRELLAHELAHVAQPAAPGRSLSRPGDAAEREADQAARAAVGGQPATAGQAAGPAIRRKEYPGVMTGSLTPPSPDALIENASPFLAAALGSATLDNFETNKSDLKPDHQRQIASVARNVEILIRKYPGATLQVEGHADTVGTEAKNVTLGQERADAVKQALIEAGVPEALISATSRGETGPQAVPTKDNVANAKNRRVEIRFRPGRAFPRLMTGELTLDPPKQEERPPFDWTRITPGGVLPPRKPPIFVDPDDTKEPKPDYFKEIPPAKNTRKSVLDAVGESIIDPAVDDLFRFLPKKHRDWLKQKGRDAVKSGVAKGARAAAERLGVTDSGALDGIEKAAEAAIKEKGEREKK